MFWLRTRSSCWELLPHSLLRASTPLYLFGALLIVALLLFSENHPVGSEASLYRFSVWRISSFLSSLSSDLRLTSTTPFDSWDGIQILKPQKGQSSLERWKQGMSISLFDSIFLCRWLLSFRMPKERELSPTTAADLTYLASPGENPNRMRIRLLVLAKPWPSSSTHFSMLELPMLPCQTGILIQLDLSPIFFIHSYLSPFRLQDLPYLLLV